MSELISGWSRDPQPSSPVQRVVVLLKHHSCKGHDWLSIEENLSAFSKVDLKNWKKDYIIHISVFPNNNSI